MGWSTEHEISETVTSTHLKFNVFITQSKTLEFPTVRCVKFVHPTGRRSKGPKEWPQNSVKVCRKRTLILVLVWMKEYVGTCGKGLLVALLRRLLPPYLPTGTAAPTFWRCVASATKDRA